MAIEHGATEVHQWKVVELEKALVLIEVEVKVVEDRVQLVKAQGEEEKVKAITEVKLKAVNEFKTSKDVKNEVIEGSSVA